MSSFAVDSHLQSKPFLKSLWCFHGNCTCLKFHLHIMSLSFHLLLDYDLQKHIPNGLLAVVVIIQFSLYKVPCKNNKNKPKRKGRAFFFFFFLKGKENKGRGLIVSPQLFPWSHSDSLLSSFTERGSSFSATFLHYHFCPILSFLSVLSLSWVLQTLS